MYDIIDENGQLIVSTEYPQWQAWDEQAQSFYCTFEKDAHAILVRPEEENAESFYANIEGKDGYPWLTKTVRVVKR